MPPNETLLCQGTERKICFVDFSGNDRMKHHRSRSRQKICGADFFYRLGKYYPI
jgi:hypothetical protein